MCKKIVFFFILSISCVFARAYTPDIANVVSELKSLDSVGSDHVGYAGIPHPFYKLYLFCYRMSTDSDLLEMLHDKSAIVRVMGVKCIVTGSSRKIDREIVVPLFYDTAQLKVGAGGCVFKDMTVSDVVYEIRKDPAYLGPKP